MPLQMARIPEFHARPLLDQWQSCRVSCEIMQIGSETCAATVVRGMNIARAARHQQTVNTVEQRQLNLPERRYQHRMRVRAVTQRFGVASRSGVHDWPIQGERAHGDTDND